VLTLLCHLHTLQGQSYLFTQSSSAYRELVNATVIPFSAFDPSADMYFVNELQGETFHFFGVPFPFGGIKTFVIESSGALRIDNDSSLVIVDGAFTYLDSIDAGSSVSYAVEGTPGDLLVKTQWHNLGIRVGAAGNFLNFQTWVYQRSGVVEIHYGPRSANNASGFNITTGPQVGMFFSRDDFSECYEKLWITGSPAFPQPDSNATFVFNAMQGVPDSGTVYRFSPRFPTSLTENRSPQVRAWPNPCQTTFHFEMGFPLEGVRALLYNSTGHLVSECPILRASAVNEGSLNVSGLATGLYILHLRTNDRTFIQKLQISE
jgi:hypothetical protein